MAVDKSLNVLIQFFASWTGCQLLVRLQGVQGLCILFRVDMGRDVGEGQRFLSFSRDKQRFERIDQLQGGVCPRLLASLTP